jgi:quinol monooxygenase YgiN
MSVKPNKQNEFIQTVHSLIGETNLEKECLNCHLYQDTKKTNNYCLLEEWTSQESLDNYFQSDRFNILLGGMRILLENPPAFKVNKVTDLSKEEALKKSPGEFWKSYG